MNIYNNISPTSQNIYDSYNELVFSSDVRVLRKMMKKITIYESVKYLFGDILEFGVFKGASVALWLQLVKMNEHNSLTKVIGFDFFNPNEENECIKSDLMQNVLVRVDKNDLSIETIDNKLKNIFPERYQLIKGDAIYTSLDYANKNIGARIKLLYLDMDVEEPTFNVLKNLWDKIVIGGKIIADEYGYYSWSESNGIDNFLKTIPGKFSIENTNIISPTLIITKICY